MNASLARSYSLATLAIALLSSESVFAIECRITVRPISFGIYTPLSATNVDVTGQIDLRCRGRRGSFAVILGPGISGDQLARTLTAGGSNILNYNFYRDPARTQIWGDGTPPTFVISDDGRGRGRGRRRGRYSYPVYGRIFANQAPNSGSYADNIIVTVLY